jgi:hexosaminidase
MKTINLLQKTTGKTSVRCSICLLLIVSMGSCQKEKSVKTAGELLPAPQKVELKAGIFINPNKLKTIYLYSAADENDRFAADLLREEINNLFNYSAKLQVVESYKDISNSSIILGIPSQDPGFSNFCSGLPIPQKDNEESYVMDVSEKSIIISGGGKAGLFYGVQTLIQLMEEAKWEHESLQGLLIQDWPKMKLRLVHYNYFFHLDRYEYIKESIKKLAKYKVNGVVIEFEDRFKYQKHPVIAAPTSLTSGQVKELTQFAHQYHVDIIPLVQGLGHAGFILKHDEFKHLREDPEIIQSCCPLKEGTYELLFDMYSETIEATPGVKYFHIGGDEVNHMAKCPLCKKKKEEIGELGLYLTWLNRVHDFMKEHGRTILWWDDMPLKQAGLYWYTYRQADEKFDSVWTKGIPRLDNIINKFPQDGVFTRWNYELGNCKGNLSILDWYKKNNFKVIVATSIIGNWPLIPDYKWTPENIKSYVTIGAEKDALGELCTSWGDDAGNHFEINWLGFLASVEYAWNSENSLSVDRFWGKYIRRFFGPNTTGLVSAFQNLSERVVFWNSALMKKGQKNRKGYKLLSLPDLQSLPQGGSWTKQLQPLLDSAEVEKNRCTKALEILDRNINKVTRNGYNLEVFASMGRLMKAHCDFVLSIGEIAKYCDKAINADQNHQKEEVITCLNKMATTADLAWNKITASYEDLKKVWEIARYPKGEEGYMMDPQTSYLTGWTADLSYLILAEEKLDFPGYAKKLIQLADQYQKSGSFSK